MSDAMYLNGSLKLLNLFQSTSMTLKGKEDDKLQNLKNSSHFISFLDLNIYIYICQLFNIYFFQSGEMRRIKVFQFYVKE